MPAGDSRKEYLLSTTGNNFGISTSDSILASQHDASAVNSFLDDGNISILAARLEGKPDSRSIKFSNKVT
jgi:hypothetical protein